MRELEKILEEIENLHTKILNDGFACKVTEREIMALMDAKDIIRKHMNDGWIPVEERLPEREGRYLVTFRNPRNVGLVGYGTCRRDLFGREIGFGWYDLHEAEYFSRDAVIAWMPLPEPYREGG